MKDQSAYLKVLNIKKSFGGVEALKGVDIEVNRGEVVALVGDNGAGKSTLMKIIAGAQSCDSGQFIIDDNEVKITSPHDATNQGIQIVYQDLALCENLSVSDNLGLAHEPTFSGFARFLPRILRPIDNLLMEKNAQEAISNMQIKTLKSVRNKVGVLSGGQRQALAIARATSANSSVVLLDEPTAALGVQQTRQVLDVVKRLRETNHAVIYISHNLKDIFEISDRITVLRHGANEATFKTTETTPDEIVVTMTHGLEARP